MTDTTPIDELVAQLRKVCSAIAGAVDDKTTTRDNQMAHLVTALANGATVTEAVTASGLSRAYLHKIGVPLYCGSNQATRKVDRRDETQERRQERSLALESVTSYRDHAAGDDAALSELRAERTALVQRLLALQIDQVSIAADAGVSAEWIRRIANAYTTTQQ